MKFFKLFIIPILLVFGYFILVSSPYFFSKINSFHSLGALSLIEEQSTPLKQETNSERVTDQLDNHLLKGEKIGSRITATEDNLGIVLVRFTPFSAKIKDSVVFRIKEARSKKWYYENTYRADQFQPNQYFTFGFPPIVHSKGKVYVFEIESLAGTVKDDIGISSVHPQVAFVYSYNKEQLKDVDVLSFFVNKKFAYVFANVNIWQYWQLLFTSFFVYFGMLLFFMKKKAAHANMKKKKLGRLRQQFMKKIKLTVHSYQKIGRVIAKKWYATRLYSFFLNTNMKKRLIIGLVLFLFAFIYRVASASVDQLGVASFYAGLGGRGDYDQFVRAATCALQFCPAILGQNFLLESSLLGIFFTIFGFIGGIKAYLYLMISLSSIVAILPYVILSRKHFLTVGGIVGSLFLATSDYLTNMAINLPPDNGSLFTFSMFYVVFLLAMHFGTIRWLVFLGLVGLIDGLNKLTFLLNDLAALVLFVPAFFIEKTKKIKKFPFITLRSKLIRYSLLPLVVFIVIYSAWEYIVKMTFGVFYYFGALIQTGGHGNYVGDYIQATPFNEKLVTGNILEKLYYYAGSLVVFQKRIIDNTGFDTTILVLILLGLLFVTFRKFKFIIIELISITIFLAVFFIVLILFKNNYLNIQEIGQYVYAWSFDIYVNVFLFTTIIFLVILNFRYKAFKFSAPIITYVVMLIILTKNAPWDRLLVATIVWNVILFSFLVDRILDNVKENFSLKKLVLCSIVLFLFIMFYISPKTSTMMDKFISGIDTYKNEIAYLRWVNSELPNNAIILLGGKSDLVTVGENIHSPIIYNSLWAGALLIEPKKIPRVKPTDFTVLTYLKINEMPGVTPSKFSIIAELKKKDNFKKNTYLILEDDISLWRGRRADVVDNVFASTSATLLHPEDYKLTVYKFNETLHKGIYELKLKRD